MSNNVPKWLSSAVFYQIYPQSFYDSNGDGIGDIGGIIKKLDYVQSLGCNAIWLNPCFESPFNDAGYDVTDFCRVAPRYGTNADLRRLFSTARRRGIRVCLDLVAGHTSIDNPWFVQSCRPTKNKYSDWFIWTDDWARPTPLGFKFVNGFAPRNGSYLANFFCSQPALNYGFADPDPDYPWQLPIDHPGPRAVRREIIKIMRYWLDAGAAGFRVDMAASLVKGDDDAKMTSQFWRQVRTMLDHDYPDAALIAEWSDPTGAIKAGFHADFFLHFREPAYASLFRAEDQTSASQRANASFFAKAGRGNIQDFLTGYLNHYRSTRRRGHISLVTGNHDIRRISLGRTGGELKLVFAFLLTMPGIPFIYYGDEIGMRHLDLPSKEGGYTRTGGRTPMQWNARRNAGFSTARPASLYLPIDPAYKRPSVAAQDAQANSLLNAVRKLIALRQSSPALGADGAFEVIYAQPHKYPFVYLRRFRRQRFLVALNPSAQPVGITCTLPPAKCAPTLRAGGGSELTQRADRMKLSMAGISYAVYQI